MVTFRCYQETELEMGPVRMCDKRTAASIGILFIFGFGLWLRMSGLDWAIREGFDPHPDERHVANCINYARLDPVEPKADDEHYFQYLARYWHHQIYEPIRKDPKPDSPLTAPLRPINFNYGTLPYYLYDMTAPVVISPRTAERPADLVPFTTSIWLRCALILLTLGIGLVQASRVLLRKATQEGQAGSREGPGSFGLATLYLALPVMAAFTFFGVPSWVLGGDAEGLSRALNYYGGTILIGRLMTAWAGAASVYILYRIGRDAYGAGTGLLGAAMLATAVLHVQLSHFATVDILCGFFVICALSQFLQIARQPRLIPYILGALFTGFAIACKWSAITLPGVLLLAHACGTWGKDRHGQLGRWLNTLFVLIVGGITLHFFKAASSRDPHFDVTLAAFRDFYVGTGSRIGLLLIGAGLLLLLSMLGMRLQSWWDGEGRWGTAWGRFVSPWFFLVLAVPVGMLALFIGEPFAFTEADRFASDIVAQYKIIVSGEAPIVFTQQYRDTTPFLYLFDNLFYPSLDWMTASALTAGLAFAIYWAIRHRKREDLVLLAWVLPNLFLYATVLCKFPRYMAPILPIMLLFGARLLCTMVHVDPRTYHPTLARFPQWAVRAVRPVGWALITLCLIASTLYAHAYVRDVYGSTHTMTEFHDWWRANYAGKGYAAQSWDELGPTNGRDRLNLHADRDSPQKLRIQLANITKSDAIALASKRAYGTTFRWPERFGNTNTLFRLMFAEQIGFKVAKVFDRTVNIGPWKLYADDEDESFKVYDHPKIVVWENVDKLDADQIRPIVENPPEWIQDVDASMILSVRDGKTIFEPDPRHPVLAWLLIAELLGIVGFLLVFRWSGALPDRGFAIGKIVGMASFSWLSWYLAATELLLLSRLQLALCFVLLLSAALFLTRRHGAEIWRFAVERRWLLIGTEILFLAAFAWFLHVRSWNPAIRWGEKPMDMSFLSAIFKASTFPTDDPWISGRLLSNYYYYGYVLLGLPARLIGLPPNYFYNIAVCAIPALTVSAVFGLVYALTRSWKAGVLGSFLAVFASHLYAFLRLIFTLDGNSAYFRAAPPEWAAIQEHWWETVKIVWRMALYSVGLAAPAEGAKGFLGFDTFFWPTGHNVTFGTNANEFPIWTYLFADLHAHMIVMPVAAAFLVCAYAWYRYETSSKATVTGRALCFFVLALLLGTVTTTNTWNAPGLALFTLLISGLIFRERDISENRQARPGWLTPRGLSRLAPLLAGPFVIGLSWFLFLPFHFHFVTRVTGARIMEEGQTPLLTYVLFYALFLLPICASILWFTLFPNGKFEGSARRLRDYGSKRKLALLATALGVALMFGLWRTIQIASGAEEGGAVAETHDIKSILQWVLSGGAIGVLLGLACLSGGGPWRRLLLPTVLFVAAIWSAQQINQTLPIHFTEDGAFTKAVSGLGLTHSDTVTFRDQASAAPKDIQDGARGYDATTALMLAPFWILTAFIILRRRTDPERRFALSIVLLALSISIGTELIYVNEPPWGPPNHRCNDIFKFFLVVWNLFSVGAACLLCWMWRAWRTPVVRPSQRLIRGTLRWGFAFTFIALAFLCSTFTVCAPYTVTEASGARCNQPPRPTLDGTAYLPGWQQQYGQDDAKLISWLNWRTEGRRPNPVIAEYAKEIGYNEQSRIAVFTGRSGLAAPCGRARQPGSKDAAPSRHSKTVHDAQGERVPVAPRQVRRALPAV